MSAGAAASPSAATAAALVASRLDAGALPVDTKLLAGALHFARVVPSVGLEFAVALQAARVLLRALGVEVTPSLAHPGAGAGAAARGSARRWDVGSRGGASVGAWWPRRRWGGGGGSFCARAHARRRALVAGVCGLVL